MGYEIDIGNKKITIDFDPDSKELSKSGKSYILASSRGFINDSETGIGISYNIVRKVVK